jgi:hypothetical protein
MTHRAPDVDDVPPRKPLVARVFQERYAPHLGFAAVTGLYIAFYVVSSVASGDFTGAAVPQTISLAWTGTLATWFGYLIRQRTTKGE